MHSCLVKKYPDNTTARFFSQSGMNFLRGRFATNYGGLELDMPYKLSRFCY